MAFCTKCGKELVPGEAFCRNCGERADLAAVNLPQKNKKKRKKAVFAAIIAVVILGASVAFGFPYVKTAVLTNIMPSEKYFSYVMKNNVEGISKKIASATETLKENVFLNNGTESKTEIVAGDALSDYCNKLIGTSSNYLSENIGWIKSIELSASQMNNRSEVYSKASLSVNNNYIGSCEYSMALGDGSMYVTFPDINPTSLKIDMGEGDVSEDMKSMYAVVDVIPSKDIVEKLISDYIMTAVNETDNVAKRRREVSLGGKSYKCTALTAEIDSDMAQRVYKAVLEKAKTDDEIRKMTETFADWSNSDPDEIYGDFTEAVDELLDNSDIDINGDSTFTVLVNGKGDIIGMSAEADGDEISYLKTLRGRNFAYEIVIDIDDEKLSIEGDGTVKGTKCESDCYVICDSGTLFGVHMTDINALKLKDGFFEGEVTISSGNALKNELGIANSDILDKSQIKYVSYEADKNKNKFSLSLAYDNSDVVSINMQTNRDGGTETMTLPEDYISADDYFAIGNWIEKSDFGKLLDNLSKSGAHGEWFTEIKDEMLSQI